MSVPMMPLESCSGCERLLTEEGLADADVRDLERQRPSKGLLAVALIAEVRRGRAIGGERARVRQPPALLASTYAAWADFLRGSAGRRPKRRATRSDAVTRVGGSTMPV